MTARDHIIDANGARVVVGDRIAAAVNSWDGPNLVIGVVAKLTASRASIRPEVHTSDYRYGDFSIIDDSLKRFVKLPEVVE